MKNLALLTIAILLSACSQTSAPPATATNPPPSAGDMTVCTMEAKICPDGSAVARTGPKCEFAACPETPAN